MRAIQLLEDTVTPIPQWSGLTRSGGILNIAAAIGTPPAPASPFRDHGHDLLPPSGRDLPTNDVDLFDVDGDGDLDIVGFPCDTDGFTAVPQLLINDGTGHFTLSTAAWPQHAVSHCDADFGDIDGDGDLDVVAGGLNTADPDSSVNQNEVYLNGGGVFQLATTGRLPAETDPTRATALCDVDSDGDLDLFSANYVPNTDLRINRLYINDGTGVFADETSARLGSIVNPVVGAPTKILCAELTQSAATLCPTGDPACLACADPTMSAQGLFASGAVPDLAACLAIRASVAPEVVVAGSQGTITRLLRNQGAGVFAETTADLNLPGVRQEQDVDGADVDGDGDVDLMFATALGNRNLLMLNNGAAVFSEAPSQPLNTVGDWCREAELGDFDGNGSIDVLLLRGDPNLAQGGSPTIYLNQGGALFSEWAGSGLDTSYRLAADGDIGDVNGDGWLDILVGNYGSFNQLFIRTP